MNTPIPILVAVPIILILQGITNSQLASRVHELEQTVRKLDTYYKASAGTETGMAPNEQAIIDDLIKMKKQLERCCGTFNNR